MSRREQILIAAVVLLVGILLGILIASLGGDDGDDAETGDGTTTTTAAETTTTTEAPTTTEPATATISATTTTEPPPVANAVNGEIRGLPIGTNADTVIDAMTAIYGAPDGDTGWNVGCPLDGGTEDDERRISWGNLRIRLFQDDDGQILAGWAYEQGAAGFFDPEGPTPDDIVMGTGVAWNQTIVQVASVLVGTTQIAEEFPLVFVRHDGEGDYRAGADNLDAPMDYVGFRAFDLCD